MGQNLSRSSRASAFFNVLQIPTIVIGNKDHARIAGVILRGVIFLALTGAIFYRLQELGFANILANLPSSPIYYALFALVYFTLPLSEVLVYRKLWQVPGQRLFPALIRKRILNEGVIGYSGEAYFGIWASRRLGLPAANILAAVKDSNFISSFASLTVTIALTVLALSLTQIMPTEVLSGTRRRIFVAIAVGAGVIILTYSLRHKLLSVRGAALKKIAAIYFARLLVVSALMIALWSVALPGVPPGKWLAVLAAYFLVRRIPFLPNSDLVLLGLGITMTGVIGASDAAVAGLFLTGAALAQIMNLLMLVATQSHASKKFD